MLPKQRALKSGPGSIEAELDCAAGLRNSLRMGDGELVTMSEWEAPEWETYDEASSEIFSLPRGDRLPLLLDFWEADTGTLPYEDVARLFADVWVDTESAFEWRYEILSLLRWVGPVFDSAQRLSGEVTIYRGVSGGRDPLGVSWTLDLERARWFAQRFGTCTGPRACTRRM